MSDELVSADHPVRRHPIIDVASIRGTRKKSGQRSDRAIESTTRILHHHLWLNRAGLFPGQEPADLLDVLDPLAALRAIGYRGELVESLGRHRSAGETSEVAGIIDGHEKRVWISRRFRPSVRNFTAAHELGHAVLHEGLGLHRDRAVHGAPVKAGRNRVEREADIFAKYFLMPEKEVRRAFELAFGTHPVVPNEETAFALNERDLDALLASCRTLRDLSRRLANANSYHGRHFNSLSEQFRVSTEAMAIRLEEMKLVGY